MYAYPDHIRALMTGKLAWSHDIPIGDPPRRWERPITILYVLWALRGVEEHCAGLGTEGFR